MKKLLPIAFLFLLACEDVNAANCHESAKYFGPGVSETEVKCEASATVEVIKEPNSFLVLCHCKRSSGTVDAGIDAGDEKK